MVRERFWNTDLASINIEIFSILCEQIWSKIQNYLFKLKFTILPGSNTLNSMLRLTFYCVNLVQNINCLFKLNIGTSTNSNVFNSMVMFTFSVLGRKYLFWANLVQKFKITCLS